MLYLKRTLYSKMYICTYIHTCSKCTYIINGTYRMTYYGQLACYMPLYEWKWKAHACEALDGSKKTFMGLEIMAVQHKCITLYICTKVGRQFL